MSMSSSSGTTSHRAADALVVGGGPAGLSAALYLARYDRTVVVFDDHGGRSTHHQVNHNYLGFPDGVSTKGLRDLGRAQVRRYPNARLVDQPVLDVDGDAEHGFTARTAAGTWAGRTVVLATGVLDHFPRFDGWRECVGRSMFWCITCDGYENRGRDILVVGHTDIAAAEAMQLRGLARRVRLLTNHYVDAVGAMMRDRLERAGIEVVHDLLDGVTCPSGTVRTVRTAGGRELEAEAIFSIQGATPESGLARRLGVRLNGDGYVDVDTEQKTSLPGVFAAGDVTALHSHQVTTAVHEGAQAAAAANYFLYPAELRAP